MFCCALLLALIKQKTLADHAGQQPLLHWASAADSNCGAADNCVSFTCIERWGFT
jgi:hypothetical protein